MVKIQVELSEEEDVFIELVKIANGLQRKSDAVRLVIRDASKSKVYERFKLRLVK